MTMLLPSIRFSSRTLGLALLSTTGALGATALVVEAPKTQPAHPIVAVVAPPKAAKVVAPPARPVASVAAKAGPVLLSGMWQKSYDLTAGKVVEISVHLDKPSTLPPNGRIAVEWKREGWQGSLGKIKATARMASS